MQQRADDAAASRIEEDVQQGHLVLLFLHPTHLDHLVALGGDLHLRGDLFALVDLAGGPLDGLGHPVAKAILSGRIAGTGAVVGAGQFAVLDFHGGVSDRERGGPAAWPPGQGSGQAAQAGLEDAAP